MIKNIINKCIKKLNEQEKKGVSLYLEWYKLRKKLNKNISNDKIIEKDYLDLIEHCKIFYKYLEDNKDLIKTKKIKSDEILKILNKDIKFCQRQLHILKLCKQKELK